MNAVKPSGDGNGAHELGTQLTRGTPEGLGLVGAEIPTPTPPPSEARPFDAAHVPCLRNCRYYFSCVSHLDHGVPAGVLAQEPLQRHHICKAIPGVYLELSGDSPVYECSDWDPVDGAELHQLEQRRDRYYNDYPDHRPTPEEVLDADDFDPAG